MSKQAYGDTAQEAIDKLFESLGRKTVDFSVFLEMLPSKNNSHYWFHLDIQDGYYVKKKIVDLKLKFLAFHNRIGF